MDWNDNNITDEMLAAYIDGNASEGEKTYIEMMMSESPLLSEAIDVVKDSINYMESFSDMPLEDLFDTPQMDTANGFENPSILSHQMELDGFLLNNEFTNDMDIERIDDVSDGFDNDLTNEQNEIDEL